MIPTPGSDEALVLGCTCPVLDNAHGKGAYGGTAKDEHGKTVFWRDTETPCPVHVEKEASA